MRRPGNPDSISRSNSVVRRACAVTLLFAIALLAIEASCAIRAMAVDPASSPGQSEDIASTPLPGSSGDVVAQPVSTPADPIQAALVKHGEYLAVAGDCQSCHSIPGGAPFAGGQPVQTPFGDLFTPNITPDKTFGIGSWSNAQFWNALHNGIGPGHSLLVFPHYLYPVMPWQDYNKLSYDDVMAIKAYLDSLPPVAQKNRPTEMGFPFTIRAGLLPWRLLFFNNSPIQYQPSWSPQVRNGAFLVQALAHCSECHTQRNLLMAIEPSRYLAGGHILAQSWYAPNITMAKTDGISSWSTNDLFNYLYRAGALGTGAPYGPMKEVVDDSLSRLPASSVQDIVAYLQSGTTNRESSIPPAPTSRNSREDGGRLYAENCARCHGANGEGVDNNFPNLAGNGSVWDGPPENVESMILGGYPPWHANQSSMPAFNQILSDQEIAAIANYIRTSWNNNGVADATANNVAHARQLASQWIQLNTASTDARLQYGGTSETFDDISGELEMFGDRQNCMLAAQFETHAESADKKSIHLDGSCASQGSKLDGEMVIDGKSYPVSLTMLIQRSPGSSHLLLFGRLPDAAGKFDARIALALPNY